MDTKQFINNIIKDIEVDLSEAFDRNFERKAFFDKKWASSRYPNRRGSLLLRSGRLRRSISSSSNSGQIKWKSNLPYATIHNEGGEIRVTAQMKRFFWAMFYKNTNAVVFRIKTKKAANTKRNRTLTAEAAKWKAMALLKVGATMSIEQRQFIGLDHPRVKTRIKNVVDLNLEDLNKEIIKKLK